MQSKGSLLYIHDKLYEFFITIENQCYTSLSDPSLRNCYITDHLSGACSENGIDLTGLTLTKEESQKLFDSFLFTYIKIRCITYVRFLNRQLKPVADSSASLTK